MRKEQLDSSESEGDAKMDPSSSSDSSCNSSSDSSSELEEDVHVVKEKKWCRLRPKLKERITPKCKTKNLYVRMKK